MSRTIAIYKIRRTDIALFYIGFASILSQILLVREFLVSFYGNELSIGIIFAGWLIWIGVGSAFGNRVIRLKKSILHFLSLFIAIAPLVTFAQIIAVKFVHEIFQTTAGEFLSMIELLGSSSVILSAGCFLWGMLFTLGAKVLSSDTKELWFGVNKAYVLESLGSVVGGLLFSFVLGSLLSTLQIVFLIVLVGWSVALWLEFFKKKWLATFIPISLVILYAILLQSIYGIEHRFNVYQWHFINGKLTFIRSIDTKYQNLSLLNLENQNTIYADGRPTYNIPNTYDAELFAHSIMIHCLHAQRVLVLGGGFNGVLREILKYPVQEVDYVEIDPALLPFAEPLLDTLDRLTLHNVRVKIVSGDGREYLHRTGNKYDIILLNVGEPSTASLNRFFTLEFYQQCVSRLSPDGILALSFPSSTEYIADELKDLDASLYHTFKQVFTNSLIIPGTHAILIGSNSGQPFVSQSDSLAHRYRAAGISAEYFSEYMYEDLMLPERIKFFTNLLDSVKQYHLNTDENPVTYYFDLLLWNRFLHGDNQFFSYITRTRIFIAGSVCTGLLLLILLVRKQKKKQEQIALATIISIGGMIGMALNLLLLLNFQETFGSVYEMVGAMIAANMVGLALGALIAARLTRKYRLRSHLLVVLIVLVVIVLLLPSLLSTLFFVRFVPCTLFIIMLCGGLIGMLFGIVNQFYLQHSQKVGSMYTFDVLGSSIGALITCSILLPVLGIQEASFFLALIFCPSIVAAARMRRNS